MVRRLTALGQTVACAESLTAGMVTARIADVPGASTVLRGGVVAYAAEAKVALLGVPAALIAQVGTVDEQVARTMAEVVRKSFAATWGLATTGIAGPGPAEGKPAGTVWIAASGPAGTATRRLTLQGDRAEVRAASVTAVLHLLAELLAEQSADAPPVPE